MKVILSFSLMLLIISNLGACKTKEKTTTASAVASVEEAKPDDNPQYLPDFLAAVQLDMPQRELLEARPKVYPVNEVAESDWETYTEDFKSEQYTSIYYSFEKTGAKALKEIKLITKQVSIAQELLKQHFGQASDPAGQIWSKVIDNSVTSYTVVATLKKQNIIYTRTTALEYDRARPENSED